MAGAVAGPALRSAVMTSTLPALKAAKLAAPVRVPEGGRSLLKKTYKGRSVMPGFGRDSVARKSILRKDKRGATVMIGVTHEAFYMTTFVELGTSRAAAQPWLVPAFKTSIPAMNTRLRKQLKVKIDGAAKKK